MPIELKGLEPLFIGQEVIDASEVYGAQLSFEQGKRYLIQAPSGKGKSTLLNILYGIQNRYKGDLSGNENGRQRFSYVLQDLRLFPELSALENVQIKNELHAHKTNAEIRSMLESVGLDAQVDQALSSLSYGQRQRVAIVRALCMPFEFLLLDEPFSHLDMETAKQVCGLIDAELEAQSAGLIIAMLDASEHFQYDQRYKL